MQKLRKLLILVIAVIATLTFSACGGAPSASPSQSPSAAAESPSQSLAASPMDGMEAAVAEAEMIIDSISERDYQPVFDVMTDEMQALLPVDKMKEGFDPVMDASGSFVKYTGAETTEAAQNGVDYIVVVVSAKYEKATRVYTISLTTDGMKLGGLYVK